MSETQTHIVAGDSEEFLSLSLGIGSSSKSFEKKEYGCRFCHRKFSSFQALGGHQNAHRREKMLSKIEEFQMENYAQHFYPYYVGSTFYHGIGNPSWPQYAMMNNSGWNNPIPMNNNVAFGNYNEANNEMQVPPYGAGLNNILMENNNPYVPNTHQISSSLPDLRLRL
ncbi:hypothetical protein RYX36_021711 [Vicia faba]